MTWVLILLNVALPFAIIFTLFIVSTQLLITHANGVNEPEVVFGRSINPNQLKLKQQLTNFRFYLHEVSSGLDPTAFFVLRPPTNLTSQFGTITITDNTLTIAPELDSRLIGRAQGLFTFSSQAESSLFMAMNFVFLEGAYNGSTVAVLGKNTIIDAQRELSVIGGSGLFRFATGYAELNTVSFDPSTGYAVVEYNVYVLHY